jgi:hypothetical protein
MGWAGRIRPPTTSNWPRRRAERPRSATSANEDAFNGKESDIVILDPGDPAGDETSRTWCLKNSLRHVKHN